MKKLFAAIVLTTLAFLTATAADWANFSRYKAANADVKTRPTAVLMGDSITDNWANMRKDFFAKNNLVGRGIGGQVTSQMLVRMRADVFALRPQAVVILAGINDIAKNNGDIALENIMENIVSMAELSKLHGIKVVLCSVLPASSFPWRKEITNVADSVKQLNAMIKKYAQQNGFTYIDYYSHMTNEEGGLPQNLAKDGIHPTTDGYAIMENILINNIK